MTKGKTDAAVGSVVAVRPARDMKLSSVAFEALKPSFAAAILVAFVVLIQSLIANGASLGLLVLQGLLLLVAVTILFRCSKVSRWPLGVVLAYVLATFVFRSGFIFADPSQISTSISLSTPTLVEGLEIALFAVLIGCVSIWAGQILYESLLLRKRENYKAPKSIPEVLPISNLALGSALVITVIGSALILNAAGGLAYAFANVKVIRESLEGSRGPLLLVWTGELVALLASVSWANLNYRKKLLVVAILGVGTVTGLAIGSRGSLLPFLGCFVILIALSVKVDSKSLSGVGQVSSARNSPGRKLFLFVLPVAVLMLVFGAFKQNVTPSGDSSIDFDAVAADIGVEQYAAQFKDADYFALAAVRRNSLPDGPDLAFRALSFPVMAIPSALGIEKPRPYDYDLRAAVLGGIVETGLPASLFGELWLIGGIIAVAIGCIFVGFGLGALGNGIASRRLGPCVWSGMATGWLYLFLSRPLVISLSRMLTFTLCLFLALLLVRLLARRKSSRA